MRKGLLGSLPGLPGRTRQAMQSKRSPVQCRRPLLECLETRALPSLVTATPVVAVVPILAASNSQPLNTLLTSSNQGQASTVGGQSDGLQDGQGGMGSTSIQTAVFSLIELKAETVNLVALETVKPQQDQRQSQNDTGQGSGQADAQGGQGDGRDNSTDPAQVDAQGDQPISPDDSQTGPGDGSTVSTDPASQGAGSPNDSPSDGSNCHRSTDGSSGGPSANQDPSLDPGSSSPAVQGGMAVQSNTEVQSNTVVASPSDSKASTTTTDSLVGNPSIGSNADAGLATSVAASNQGSSADKRQHGSSDASVLEAGQRGSAGVADAKQRSPDGMSAAADDAHNPVPVKSQELEAHNHNQTESQSQQQIAADDSAQGPVAERLHLNYGSAAPASTESQFTPGEETLFIGDSPDDPAPATVYANASPQNHELLTDGLALDLSSLRSEVQRFFEHIDKLGAHGRDKQIGLVLCSSAVVVAAAMACEVARRQARRPVAPWALALASTLDLADEAEAPAGSGLPHFGQFSALC
jgi:hypothetical protein